MIKEDIHIGDTLWSWNTCRGGRVQSAPDSDGKVMLYNEGDGYFTEPYYALMPVPASQSDVTKKE